MKMSRLLSLVAVSAALVVFKPIHAASAEDRNKTCPVDTLQKIDEDLVLEYEGKKVFFCCKSCQEVWSKNPRYVIKARLDALPQFQGMERKLGLEKVVLMAQRFCPIEKTVLVIPESPSVEYKGSKIFFHDDDDADQWKKNPEGAAAKALSAGLLPQLKEVALTPQVMLATARVAPISQDGNGELPAKVLEIFKRRCASCHGSNAAAPKKYNFVDDLTKLRISKHVKLNDPENSELYQQVLTQEMPLRTKAEKEAGKDAEPLKPDEVAVILAWIKAGAPDGLSAPVVAEAPQPAITNNSVKPPPPSIAGRKLVTENDVIAAALQDLLQQPAEDRNDTRYVSLAPEHNNVADVKDEQLDMMRGGVRKLLNSLSTNPKIAKFAEVGPEKVLFRVKLSDIGWDAALWDHVAGFYPYALEGAGLSGLGGACHATVPVLRADWLATNATRPPLYHDILRIPATTQELEHKLGIDLNKNLAEGRAIRSGFTKSGISLANRLVERVETGAYAGSYWKSYDFKQNSGRGRLHDFPLGPMDAHLAGGAHAFEHAGGEIVFSLPNGLHGYMLTNAAGARLDGVAPTNVVGDQTGITGRVEISNGLSCITCHDRGIKTPMPADEIRAIAGSSAFTADEQRLIERLHPEQKKMDEWLKKDEARFVAALSEAGVEQKAGREPVYALAELFERPVTLAQAAAELGLEVADFDAKAKNSSALFDIHTQLAGAGIPRDSFATKFVELALRLNLGTVHVAATLLGTPSPVKDKPNVVPLSVTLRTDKADYANKEKLIAYVKAAQDCHLRLLYKDAAGKIILLFPNKFHPDSRIPGGQEVPVPSATDTFDIEIEAPNGVESLVAIVSSTAFSDEAKIQDALKKAPDPEKVFIEFADKDIEVAVAKSARLRVRESRLGVARVNLTTHP